MYNEETEITALYSGVNSLSGWRTKMNIYISHGSTLEFSLDLFLPIMLFDFFKKYA